MAYSFPLGRAFLAGEYGRQSPSRVRIIGTLLDSAFVDPPRNRDLERLCTRLDHGPTEANAQLH